MPRLLPRRQRRAGGNIIDRPGLRLPYLKTVEHHAVGKKLEIIQRQDITPAALTAADITVGLQQIIRLFHRGDVDLVFPAHKPIRRQQLSGRDLAGADLCAQLRIDLLIQALCAVADYAHAQNPDCLVIVDNTFATPLLVQPLKLGADVVVHSATKYLNGHGDVVAGFSVARKEIMDQIRMVGLKDITGAVLGPQEAFLILRGLKTLKVRMDAVCANTQKVVDFLTGSKYVQKVFYPSLENHPDHAVAVREMTRFCGVVSFEMGSFEEAKKVLNHVHLCALAVSLGDCETLIQHPASMTHSMCTKEEIKTAGFSDRLIRLAVGLEDTDISSPICSRHLKLCKTEPIQQKNRLAAASLFFHFLTQRRRHRGHRR